MADKRGIVISQPFEVLQGGGINLSGSPLPADIMKYLLYWDRIDYPDNNFVSIGGGPDIEFLIAAGVAERTVVRFQGTISSGNGEFFLIAQQATFDRHDKEEPGLWSLAQLSNTPYFVASKPNNAIEYQLWDTLPVPQANVPLNDILEYKANRKDELIALRTYMDELYQNIISAADIPRAKTSAIAKLEKGLADVDKTLAEFGIAKAITSLRGYIAGEFANIVGAGLGAAGLASTIGMPPLLLGTAGAAITFAVKPVLCPKTPKESHPLIYVSNLKKKL